LTFLLIHATFGIPKEETMNLDTKVTKKIKQYKPKGNLDLTAEIILAFSGVNHPQVKSHCQRVGLLAEATAQELGKDTKAALFAGLLHDSGKITQPHTLFDGHNISAEEYEEVKKHVIAGFDALKKHHLFVALCAGLHHALFPNGYGLKTNVFPKNWHMGTVKKILEISAIISVCDFTDAFCHRTTKIKDGSDQAAPDLKRMLYAKYPEDHRTIDIVLRKNKELGFV
jgi:putative nucleotidyltransferase with HDIG domain